jgi:hypothetical protein
LKGVETVCEYVLFEEQMNEAFDKALYDAKLADIMRAYTTKDMVRYSEVNCRI